MNKELQFACTQYKLMYCHKCCVLNVVLLFSDVLGKKKENKCGTSTQSALRFLTCFQKNNFPISILRDGLWERRRRTMSNALIPASSSTSS